MTQDNQPKIPNLPPLIANGDANRGYYVCTYKNKWDSLKKRSVRIRSTSVGRVQGKDKYGLIEFYDEFIKQYPSLKRFSVYRTDGPQRLVFIPKQSKRRRTADEAAAMAASSNARRGAEAEMMAAPQDPSAVDLVTRPNLPKAPFNIDDIFRDDEA